MATRTVPILALLLAGAACAAPTAPADGENLATARARWRAQGGESYSYVINRSCPCVLGGRTMSVTVRNGSVTSAEYLLSGSAVESSLLTYVSTVPDLFDLIQDALDRKASYLAATYDPNYGYPTRIEIDYSANVVDDDVAMSARDLTVSTTH